MQKGAAELEKQNGVSLTNLNLLAYAAVKEVEVVVGSRQFCVDDRLPGDRAELIGESSGLLP